MGRCAHQEPKLYRWNARSAQEHSKLESKMASAARTLKGRRNHSLQSWKLQGAACRSQSTWAKKQRYVVLCCLCTRGCPKFHDMDSHTHIYIWILCETKQNPRTPLEAAFAATTELCTSNRWKRWLWVEYTGCTLIWLVSWTFLIVQGDSHPIFGLSNQKV